MTNDKKQSSKNIIICLDGTGNEYGENLSNVVKIFRMLEREPGKQVAFYDPGVGTIEDPSYKTGIAKKINLALGMGFGRGLMKNMIEAYTYLMEQYEDGDKVFIFGFSRGAYTARALAAFIKECGLFERGAGNMLPYAMKFFLDKAPEGEEEKTKFYKVLSGFRGTYGRLLNRHGDPRYPEKKGKAKPNYQLRIHFLGLFDTVKSYGMGKNPVILRNETKNDSVLNVRHALAIDERRAFFHQMHWKSSRPERQTCKEVWFAGVHSDVGGSYPEPESGLAEVALEWMVHEACTYGMKVDLERYGITLQKNQDDQGNWIPLSVKDEDKGKYTGPNALADAHESLQGGLWKTLQIFPKGLEPWEESKNFRTIKSEKERLNTEEDNNPIIVHQSVIDRINADIGYLPKNLLKSIGGDINALPKSNIEQTIPTEEVFGSGLNLEG